MGVNPWGSKTEILDRREKKLEREKQEDEFLMQCLRS